MVIEHFAEGAAAGIYRNLRDHGRRLPAGLEYIESWVDLDYWRCFQLMRTDDPALFDEWTNAWGEVGQFEVIPVRTSAEAQAQIADQL
ncbi:MAG TPA: DUF3303 family protein [Dehalococcoidia bacterium]|nr:DUF3303 family protein [Dehalococcoidia bacterium]